VPYKGLDVRVETASGHVSVCTMHLAKGLEFRAVAVMACDDEVIPRRAGFIPPFTTGRLKPALQV